MRRLPKLEEDGVRVGSHAVLWALAEALGSHGVAEGRAEHSEEAGIGHPNDHGVHAGQQVYEPRVDRFEQRVQLGDRRALDEPALELRAEDVTEPSVRSVQFVQGGGTSSCRSSNGG